MKSRPVVSGLEGLRRAPHHRRSIPLPQRVSRAVIDELTRRPATLRGPYVDAEDLCSPPSPLRVCLADAVCWPRADGFGDDDAAAAGATGSVPDLSTMRLDSFHEARRATLAYITGGDAVPLPSDTSTSGDSGAPLRSLPSLHFVRQHRANFLQLPNMPTGHILKPMCCDHSFCTLAGECASRAASVIPEWSKSRSRRGVHRLSA